MIKEQKQFPYVYLHRNWFLNGKNLNTDDSQKHTEHMEKNHKSTLLWKSAVYSKVAAI